jgi:hypothetical protein
MGSAARRQTGNGTGTGFMTAAFRRLAVMLLLALPAVPASAAEPVDTHLGVSSCGGSTCHGAAVPWRDSAVLQNEFITWSGKDRHSKAWQTLQSAQSRRIAANLGLPNAHEQKICLDCHADNVPVEQRGVQFQISDGVGCESCHGGAERWLGVHLAAKGSHADNVAAGMIPTEDPLERANLCISCHFGDETRFVTHRMYGAGHPRLSFELDTFTTVQPAHYKVDDDYRRRKQVANGVQTWAIGQAVALERLARSIADPKRNSAGPFPEYSLYDCQACHTPLTNVNWQAQPLIGTGPGVIRLQNANAAMLYLTVRALQPEAADSLLEAIRSLHRESVRDRAALQAAAQRLAGLAQGLATGFAGRTFGPAELRKLFTALLQAGSQGDFSDYASAEQATMALAALIDALKTLGMVEPGTHKTLQSALEPCYSAVSSDATFKPESFVTAIRQVQGAVPAF